MRDIDMEIPEEDVWLQEAICCPSPNFNNRPAHREIDLLVIHNISLPPKQFGGGFVEAFFQNSLNPDLDPYFATLTNLQVSSHFFIDRTGKLTQFVPLNRRAWHAGVSSFLGESNCNDFSIGIELEGADDIPYTDAQYDALNKVTRTLQDRYPKITSDRITGHDTIAPGRKTDPGAAFDWSRYRHLLAGNISRIV